jgi:NhaP-type Na+/H+ or K+/H+ antiporter
LLSLVIGIFFGFSLSYLTKKFRFIAQNVVSESVIFLSFAYVSYLVAEFLEASSIVTILVTSIVMAHYAWHNLSPQGKHVTQVTFSTLGFGSESFVFCYVGLAVILYVGENLQYICWKFVICMLFIIIIGRFLAIFTSYYIFFCKKSKEASLSIS